MAGGGVWRKTSKSSTENEGEAEGQAVEKVAAIVYAEIAATATAVFTMATQIALDHRTTTIKILAIIWALRNLLGILNAKDAKISVPEICMEGSDKTIDRTSAA